MKPILCAVALALLPASDPAPLTARCLWAERGWRCEALAVDLGGENAIAAALVALGEHRRLHGWGSLEQGRTSWMISVPAACPPAALAEFARRELPVAAGELVRVYRELALVLAKNRVTEGALRFLDALRSEPGSGAPEHDRERESALRDAARVLFAAREWERALDGLAELDLVPAPNGRASLEALRDGMDTSPRDEVGLLRARCLLELGRTKELEGLCVARITAGGAVEPSCRWIELLVEGWERAGMPPQRQSLNEALFARFAGRPSLGARIVLLDALWEVALHHRHLLAMDEFYAFAHVVDLLDAGDHRQDVLERIAKAGPRSLDALIDVAHTLPRDDPRELRLHDVLAATGDARVLPLLEARFPDREEITAKLRLESWRSANALRRDLESAQR